jgi:hypothetical protein
MDKVSIVIPMGQYTRDSFFKIIKQELVKSTMPMEIGMRELFAKEYLKERANTISKIYNLPLRENGLVGKCMEWECIKKAINPI